MSANMPGATPPPAPRVWQVGALCRAVADALDARFGAVTVQGEVSGFGRAASGHCYFSLKDDAGQLRCAMFCRAASLLDWAPRDGDLVELRGRVAVYEQRGDLQLVVESMRRAGQGALYEDFLRRKAQLEAQGLFDAAHKRVPTAFPRGIGLVTSPNAAALRDVLAALRRRAPHVPVLLVPALVQGAAAPASLVDALQRLYHIVAQQQAGQTTPGQPAIDTLVLVRGGGSIEDLWAFNDTQLAHTIVQSPVPLICGVGHETDVTIADFCADLRAPTPTAAAELAAMPAAEALQQALHAQQRLMQRAQRQIEQQAQRLDRLAWGLARSARQLQAQHARLQQQDWHLQQAASQHTMRQRALLATLQLRLAQAGSRNLGTHMQAARLAQLGQHLAAACQMQNETGQQRLHDLAQRLDRATQHLLQTQQQRLHQHARQLHLLDPQQVLARGYAVLQDERGQVLSQRADFHAGQVVTASVRDGQVQLTPLQRQQPL